MSEIDYPVLRSQLTRAVELNDRNTLTMLLETFAAVDEPLAQALYHHYKAVVHRFAGAADSALKEFDAALGLYESQDDLVGMGSVLLNLGSLHSSLGDNARGIELTHHALAVFRGLSDEISIGKAIQNLGMMHTSSGNLSEGLRYLRESEGIFRNADDKANLAIAVHNIGDVYSRLGDLDSAERYFLSSAGMSRDLGDDTGVATNYATLISYYVYAGRVKDAHDLLEQVVVHAVRSDKLVLQAIVYSWAARVEALMGNVELAVRYLDKIPSDITLSPQNTGAIMIVRAEVLVLQERLNEAKEMCQAAIDLMLGHAPDRWMPYAFSCMLDIAKRQNDMQAFIHWHEEQERLNKNHTRAVDAIRIATQEKERDIEAQRREHEKHLAVLYSTLPRHVADRLVRGEDVSDQFNEATVLFLDLVGFTALSDRLTARELVDQLASVFREFDNICTKNSIVKVKTIGDAYLAFSADDGHVRRTVTAALQMLDHLAGLDGLEARIGIHSGPLIAGVVGTERLQYDVWGDTVNVASRLEHLSISGRVTVSGSIHDTLAASGEFVFEARGTMEVKGKGAMELYFVSRD